MKDSKIGSNIKILNINSYYYSSTVHQNFKNALDKLIDKFDVIVPLKKDYVVREDFVDKGLSVNKLYVHKKMDRPFFFKKQRSTLKSLSSIDINSYDLVHAHSLFTNGYTALRLKLKHNINYVVTIRSTDLNVFFKYLFHLRKTGIRILENADRIIFLSEPAKDLLLNKYVDKSKVSEISKKSIVIPSAVEDYWTNNTVKIEKNKNDIVKILFVGNFTKRKNLISLLKSVKGLSKQIEVNVVGPIVDMNRYKKIKNNYDFNYLGVLSKEKLIDEYSKNDILVVPSIHETFGLVYVEAMTQGMPVVYTKKQGFDGLFPNGTVGVSVNPTSQTEILEAIQFIYNDYSRISKNCIVESSKFDWESIGNEYLSVYRECLTSE